MSSECWCFLCCLSFVASLLKLMFGICCVDLAAKFELLCNLSFCVSQSCIFAAEFTVEDLLSCRILFRKLGLNCIMLPWKSLYRYLVFWLLHGLSVSMFYWMFWFDGLMGWGVSMLVWCFFFFLSCLECSLLDHLVMDNHAWGRQYGFMWVDGPTMSFVFFPFFCWFEMRMAQSCQSLRQQFADFSFHLQFKVKKGMVLLRSYMHWKQRENYSPTPWLLINVSMAQKSGKLN